MSELVETNENQQNLPSNSTVLNNVSVYKHTWGLAKIFSESGIVPNHYSGNPAATFVALDMARQLDVNPMQMLQSTHQISGKIGMSASLAISLANTRGPFSGPIRYESKVSGKVKIKNREVDNIEVKAYAIMKTDGERVESIAVSMKMALAENWTKNDKYLSMGEYMLRKRAANFLIRETCPEVLMGMQTDEELETIQEPQLVNVKPKISKSELRKEVIANGGVASSKMTKAELEAELEKSKISEPEPVEIQEAEIVEPEEVKPEPVKPEPVESQPEPVELEPVLVEPETDFGF